MADNNNQQINDIGFGTISRRGYGRMINRDGSFNVIRKEQEGLFVYDIFISLIDMPWWKFNFLVIGYFVLMNFVFAWIYYFIGIQNLSGAESSGKMGGFMDAFFFSSQTLTTVGYGKIAPVHFAANAVAAIEALLGLLGFAIATGLIYGRFSRPVANILFSNNMLVSPYKDGKALMFRMVNKSNNQLIDAQATMSVAIQSTDSDGIVNVNYTPLPFQLKTIRYMPTNWTLVHVLDDKSPLSGWTQDDFENKRAEFIVSFNATDDTFMQTIHTSTSYLYTEVIWGAKFVRMFEPAENGATILHLGKVSEYEAAAIS